MASTKKRKTRAKVRKPSVAAYRETDEDLAEKKRWEDAGKKHNSPTGMDEHMARLDATRRASRFHVNAGGIPGHIKPDAEADTMHLTITSQDGTQLQIDWNAYVGGFDVRAVRAAGPQDQGPTASSLDVVPLSGNLVCLRARLSAGKDEG